MITKPPTVLYISKSTLYIYIYIYIYIYLYLKENTTQNQTHIYIQRYVFRKSTWRLSKLQNSYSITLTRHTLSPKPTYCTYEWYCLKYCNLSISLNLSHNMVIYRTHRTVYIIPITCRMKNKTNPNYLGAYRTILKLVITSVQDGTISIDTTINWFNR